MKNLFLQINWKILIQLFLQLIRDVREKRDQEYIIAAIRPKGIEVFEKVRSIIEKEEIDIGYEPIEEDWTLKVN